MSVFWQINGGLMQERIKFTLPSKTLGALLFVFYFFFVDESFSNAFSNHHISTTASQLQKGTLSRIQGHCLLLLLNCPANGP